MAGLTPVRPGRFQSTLSVRRATGYLADIIAQANISIHALRKESDLSEMGVSSHALLFQSTLSVRRATCSDRFSPSARCISIHALRKESDTDFLQMTNVLSDISIHALRKESDTDFLQMTNVLSDISIHALRKESDGSNAWDNSIVS